MLDENKLKNVVREKEAYLNLLEELDRTGKMRKARYKERVNFMIDEELMTKFRRYCEKNQIKMSNIAESLIKSFLEKKK